MIRTFRGAVTRHLDESIDRFMMERGLLDQAAAADEAGGYRHAERLRRLYRIRRDTAKAHGMRLEYPRLVYDYIFTNRQGGSLFRFFDPHDSDDGHEDES